jgi:hypothetical protein
LRPAVACCAPIQGCSGLDSPRTSSSALRGRSRKSCPLLVWTDSTLFVGATDEYFTQLTGEQKAPAERAHARGPNYFS